MTGAYIKIKRDDRWQAVEIDQLTDAELVELFDGPLAAGATEWAIFLAKWIRDNVKSEAAP